MKLKIAVLPGDGIGPEISRVGVDVMKAVAEKFGHEFEFNYGLAGAAAIRATGNPFPEETLKLCKDSDAVLFSAVGDPEYDNNPEAKVRPEQGLLAMRKQLGLFANIRPIQTFPGLEDKSPLKKELVEGADFVCVRELTGGMYFGEKYESDDKASDTNLYTRPEIERILKVGYELATRRNKHLTVVDKANVLASSRLWRKVAQEMEKEWPEIATDYMFVDNASMKLIQDPRFFDVIVTENTFGDILTDEASVISGSMGLLPSSSIGESTPVFEPIHGSWPQAAGLNIANPLAQVLSVAMLLEHFGLSEEGKAVREAVDVSIKQGVVTPDLGERGKSEYGTKEVGEWLTSWIASYGCEA
ncbi:MAG: 3-isopropylmalate dehydrogenase [Muribaculaceae bacterium]|nr:3-isopropylmalate dehydrogenase [Muribaculaceae bacterium]